MGAILKVKLPDGTWADIPALVGPEGVGFAELKQQVIGLGDGAESIYYAYRTDGTLGGSISVRNGSKGSAGYTPVKGIDYFTAAEQEAMVQQVLDALGTPVWGQVDEDNVITLTGELAAGVYTLVYEDAEGNRKIIGTLDSSAGDDLPYTNQIPISTDTDGSIYNVTGYMAERRINSSGEVATLSASGATNPLFVTGFIPVQAGDIVRLKNCWIDTTNEENSATYGQNGWSVQNAFYNSTKGQIGLQVWTTTATGGNFTTATADGDNRVTEFTVTNANVAYMRLCLAPTSDPADAIVTVNQLIEE